MIKTPIDLRNEKLGSKVVKALQGRHFDAAYVNTKDEALKLALSYIPEKAVVSWGGTSTAKEIGLLDALHEGDYDLIDRDAAAPEDKNEVARKALLSDYYIMGSNAISEDGQLVNIDGNGNRLAALIFGPKVVIVLIGINKVVRDLEAAMVRAQTIAAPINRQRFPGNTPCLVTGSCGHCTTLDSICAQTVITRLCKPAGRIKVILIGENLGY